MSVTAALRKQPAPLAEVALSVGHDSKVAFSKAFKRYYSLAPGAYRPGARSSKGDDPFESGSPVTG